MEEKRPNPLLLGQIVVALSVLILAAYGCRTSEPTSDAAETNPGLESIQQRLSDVTKDLGARIGQIEYWQYSAGVYETRRVELFDDGLQCTWSIEPKSVVHAVQFFFEPGTAQLQRIHTRARDRECLENDICSIDHEFAQEVHGYAWPFEVKDEADADELTKKEARALSERRARAVLEWLKNEPLSEIREIEWHGTKMSNDERYATMFEPLGAATGGESGSSLPRYVKAQGPPLADEHLERLIRLRKLAGKFSHASVVPATQFLHDRQVTVNFDADWLRERGLEFAPEWSVNTTINKGETLLEQWLGWVVASHCNSAGIDGLEPLSEESHGD